MTADQPTTAVLICALLMLAGLRLILVDIAIFEWLIIVFVFVHLFSFHCSPDLVSKFLSHKGI